MATTFYLIPDSTPPTAQLPAFNLASTWSHSNLSDSGANAGYASLTPGTGQIASATLTGGVSGDTLGLAQYVSDYLTAQTISGTFDIGFGVLNTAASSLIMTGYAFIGLIDTSGSKTATLFALAAVDVNNSLSTGSERAAYALGLSLTSQTVVDLARIVVEIGVSSSNTANPSSVFSGGTTTISTNNATTSDAKAFVNFSGNLTFWSPLPTIIRTAFAAPMNSPNYRG